MSPKNLPASQKGYMKGRKAEDTVDKNPMEIYFSQKTISSKFRNGNLLQDTLKEILYGHEGSNVHEEKLQSNAHEQFIKDNIPPITVKGLQSKKPVATTGNRRLYLYKLLANNDIITCIVVKEAKGQKVNHEFKDMYYSQKEELEKIIEDYKKEKSKKADKKDGKAQEKNMNSTPCTSGASHAPRQDKTETKRKSSSKRPQQADAEKQNQATTSRDSRKRKLPKVTPDTTDLSKLPTKASQTEATRFSQRLASKLQASVPATGHQSTANSPGQEEKEAGGSPKQRRLTLSSDSELRSTRAGASQEMQGLGITDTP